MYSVTHYGTLFSHLCLCIFLIISRIWWICGIQSQLLHWHWNNHKKKRLLPIGYLKISGQNRCRRNMNHKNVGYGCRQYGDVKLYNYLNMVHVVFPYRLLISLKRYILNVLSLYMQLTHWGWDNMGTTSQTIFSKAFSWMEIYEFRLLFDWS